MPSAQRQYEKVMGFCTHPALPVADQVMGVVCPLVAAYAWLLFNPAGVFLVFPAAALWPEHVTFG